MRSLYSFLISFFLLGFQLSLHAQCFPDEVENSTGTYTFTLPGQSSDNYVVEIECVGADGGTGFLNGTPVPGGTGATMVATYELVGGDVLILFVGQSGQQGGNPAGGGGGGGSAVVLNSADVLIAAGAGGGSGHTANFQGLGGRADTNSPAQGGGAPGASGGGGFNSPGMSGVNSTGGGAGTLTAMGAGGSPGVVAGFGGTGWGGGGGGAGTGGGGGGGYEGGDGADGSPSLAGQGGNSFVNSGYNSSVVQNTAGITGGGSASDGRIEVRCISSSGSNLMIQIDQFVHPSCNGQTDGSITVSATGGNPPYTYAIDGGAFSPNATFTGLGAGTYTLTVMDNDGITESTMATLTDPDPIQLSIVEIIDVSCAGNADGSIEVMASGGTVSGDYAYSLNGGTPQPTGLFSNLIADTYTVSVVDDQGCSTSITATVNSPDQLLASLTAIDLLCFEQPTGIITVNASGGTAPYGYSLDGVNFQPTGVFQSLFAGVYNVTVLDANGCEVQESIAVDQPDQLILNLTSTPAGCGGAGGSIHAIAAGGTAPFQYTLGIEVNNTGLFENLSPGTYQVEVEDANGCMTNAQTDVEAIAGDSLTLSLVSTTPPSCHGSSDGSITVLADGTPPYTYSLNGTTNDNGEFTGLEAGTLIVSVTDSNGCSASLTTQLTEPDSLTLSVVHIDHVSCPGANDGVIEVSAAGGTEPYVYTNGDEINSDGIFMGLGSGTWTITVTDTNGCQTSTQAIVDEAAPLDISIIDKLDVLCYGDTSGTITIVVTSIYDEVEMSIGNTSNQTIPSGDTITLGLFYADTFSITVVDSNGCPANESIVINEPPELELAVTDFMVASDSFNGYVVVEAGGGVPPYQYSIDGGTTLQDSTLFDGLNNGSYTFTVFDSNDCASEIMFALTGVRDNYANDLLLKYYPNPTNDFLQVEFVNAQVDVNEIILSNATGKQWNVIFQKDEPQFRVDCRSLPNGIYFLTIDTSEGFVVQKFVVMK